MAQLTGTARRSTSHAPAFVVGGVLATGILTTGFAVALALGVHVELPGQAEAPAVVQAGGAPAPALPSVVRRQPYDGPLDPIERAYILGVRTERGPTHRYVPTQEGTEHSGANGFRYEVSRTYPAPR